MKYIFFILLICFGATSSKAQFYKFKKKQPVKVNPRLDSLAKAREILKQKQLALRPPKPKPIANEFKLGLSLQGSGTFIHFDRFKLSDDDLMGDKGAYVDIGELKHPRQYRIYVKTIPDPNNKDQNIISSYVYGKQNNLYLVRMGYGYKKKFTGWLYNKNVQMQWFAGAGLNLGLLKPYYLAMKRTLGYPEPFIKYSETTKDDFFNSFLINGSAGFSKGLNEISIKPGLNLKQGVVFNLFPTKHKVITCELGLTTDIFTEKVPILINVENKSVFANLYALVNIGKRWE